MERLSRIFEWLVTPIGGWAGRYFGFFGTIADLEQDVKILEQTNAMNQRTISNMHNYYMAEYRKLEDECARTVRALGLQQPLVLERMKLRGAENLTITSLNAPKLLMGTTDYQQDQYAEHAEMRIIQRTVIGAAFALEPSQKDCQHKTAVALATRAGEMAYDAVMADLGQRPEPYEVE